MMMIVSCDHDSDDDDGGSVTFHFLSSPLISSILADRKQVPLIFDWFISISYGLMVYHPSIYDDDDKDDGDA